MNDDIELMEKVTPTLTLDPFPDTKEEVVVVENKTEELKVISIQSTT